MKFTKEMIESWIGSDNMSIDEFLELLTDIINDDYPVDSFRKDVLDYIQFENINIDLDGGLSAINEGGV
jgi:hypothetical protein